MSEKSMVEIVILA